MQWEYSKKVQSYNTNRVKYNNPEEYLNCKLKLFYIQSQAPSRKTSNFPATEAIRNVNYRSSSILKMLLLLFKDQLSFVAVYET